MVSGATRHLWNSHPVVPRRTSWLAGGLFAAFFAWSALRDIPVDAVRKGELETLFPPEHFRQIDCRRGKRSVTCEYVVRHLNAAVDTVKHGYVLMGTVDQSELSCRDNFVLTIARDGAGGYWVTLATPELGSYDYQLNPSGARLRARISGPPRSAQQC